MLRTTLRNHVRQVRKDEGGFTLIELLIVIVVLGVLAGIVVFGVGTFRQDADGRGVQGRLQDRRGRRRGVQRQDRQLPGRRRRAGQAAKYLKAAPASGVGHHDRSRRRAAGCP